MVIFSICKICICCEPNPSLDSCLLFPFNPKLCRNCSKSEIEFLYIYQLFEWISSEGILSSLLLLLISQLAISQVYNCLRTTVTLLQWSFSLLLINGISKIFQLIIIMVVKILTIGCAGRIGFQINNRTEYVDQCITMTWPLIYNVDNDKYVGDRHPNKQVLTKDFSHTQREISLG